MLLSIFGPFIVPTLLPSNKKEKGRQNGSAEEGPRSSFFIPPLFDFCPNGKKHDAKSDGFYSNLSGPRHLSLFCSS
jgi:hypothetical protein